MLIERPRSAGWRLAANGPTPDESTAAVYRFRENVDPKSTFTFTVRETQPVDVSYALTNIDDNQIAVFQRQKSINPELEAAFRKIVDQKNKIAEVQAQINNLDSEKDGIYDDQQRLRENLKALKGSQEERALTERYTKQLDDQENRLAEIEKQSKDLDAQHDALQAELDKMIQDLTFDIAM
jgi:chromosome segregation ATPase